MKTTEKLFEPKIVGVQEKRLKEAFRAWIDYVDIINEVCGEICSFLEVDNISHDCLVEILSESKNDILVSLYKIKGGYPDSMDIKKMVDLGLLNHFYSEIIKTDAQEYLEKKKLAMDLFSRYDVSLLKDSVTGVYELNDDFEKSIKHFFTRFTKTKEENEALDSVLLIIKGLNYFIPSKIHVSYGMNGINSVLKMIKISEDRTKFELNTSLFMRD